jgi:16S rRNA (guanine966-N2)-methyltransferase
MRIISGEFRRRNLHTPPDASTTRPIPDRVKESVFAILRGHTEGATVLDAFSGCGAIGLEAVSRGATQCVFVEMDKKAAALIKQNIDMLGCGNRCTVVQGDALGPAMLARVPRPLKLAFFDPPYPIMRDGLGYKRVIHQMSSVIKLLQDDGYAVLRTPWPLEIPVEEASGDAPIAQSHKPKSPRAAEREELRRQLREAKASEGAAPTERVGGGARKPAKSKIQDEDEPVADSRDLHDGGTPLADLLSKALKKNPLGTPPHLAGDDTDIPIDDLEEELDELSTQKQREAWLKKQLGEDAEFEDDDEADEALDDAEDAAFAEFDDDEPDVIEDDGDVEVTEMTLEEAEALEDDDAPVVPKVTRPDLSIPGAIGPETHIYGTMAVHLYMRAKSS